MIEKLQNIFSNREISTFLWLFVILILIQFNKPLRKSVGDLIVTFFQWKILSIIISALLYTIGIIVFLWCINLWDISMLKDSILWFILSAFVIMLNLNKATKEKKYFRDIVIHNFKFVLVLEFIVNIYNFNLAIELIIMPIIVFFAIMQGYSEAKEEFHKFGRVFGGILTIFGVTLLILSIHEIIKLINVYASFEKLKTFLLPIILTIAFVPFAYFLALFMNYETLFVRLKFILRDNNNFKYAKRRIFLSSYLSLARISKISDQINELYDKSTKSDIKKLIG